MAPASTVINTIKIKSFAFVPRDVQEQTDEPLQMEEADKQASCQASTLTQTVAVRPDLIVTPCDKGGEDDLNNSIPSQEKLDLDTAALNAVLPVDLVNNFGHLNKPSPTVPSAPASLAPPKPLDLAGRLQGMGVDVTARYVDILSPRTQCQFHARVY